MKTLVGVFFQWESFKANIYQIEEEGEIFFYWEITGSGNPIVSSKKDFVSKEKAEKHLEKFLEKLEVKHKEG